MKRLFESIRQHAKARPHATALKDERGRLDYAGLETLVGMLALLDLGERTGLMMNNGIHWACLDLALLESGRVCVPMPGFFSETQLKHLVTNAALDAVLTDNPARVQDLLGITASERFKIAGHTVWMFRIDNADKLRRTSPLPMGTIKITYTSGTTGQPKGVCLTNEIIERVTNSLCDAANASCDDRSLSLLPLSTLLENIAGLYAPLWVGARAQVPNLEYCGLKGSSGLDHTLLFSALQEYAPTTTVLVPQLLKVLVECVMAGMPLPDSLRYAALGGAPTPASLIGKARSLSLPVCHGYGLSEAGSVVSLNHPQSEHPASVGRPLPHLEVEIAPDGEVIVSGNLFAGYLGEPNQKQRTVWATGDLGYLDEDGYLFLTGRKKTAYATAYGRNVSPEWVESELAAHPLFAQAAVFGEGQPFNTAIVVPRRPASIHEFGSAIDDINRGLPDYAHIGRWIIADEPFTQHNGLSNGSGCICREAVQKRYHAQIEDLYMNEARDALL